MSRLVLTAAPLAESHRLELSLLSPLLLATANAHAGAQRAGPFRVEVPAAFAPVTGPALSQFQRSVQGGARALAQSSGLADASAAAALGGSFFNAFRTADGRVTVAFMGTLLDEPADIDEMARAGAERVR
ncbi:MAG: hypothetical protein A3E25_20890 [Burkholderiales bacterium RIFCSPHIGHO2_12_FULL_69_20]|nr:MAG: hypothetical protein A3E25_20890 [Burkholderiales bacterium RIFCSPHIGHO2_12_FULL_69_20]